MTTIADLTLPRSASDSDVLAVLKKWGAAVLPDYLDRAMVEKLLNEHQCALKNPEKNINVWPSLAGRIADFNLCTANRDTYANTYRVFREPLCKSVAERYLGSSRHINYEIYATWENKPNVPSGELHYDKVWNLKNCFYLTDTSIENGAIWVVPGSHHIGTEEGEKDAHPIPIEAQAGTLIFIDSKTMHHVGPLKPGCERRTIHTVSSTGTGVIQKSSGFGKLWFRKIPWNPVRVLTRLTTHPSGLTWLELLSRERRGEAYARLGDACCNGNGADRDIDKALEFWNLAMQNGSASAAFSLAEAYAAEESGLEPDLALAIKYWKLASDRGHVTAMNRLGRLYLEGIGVPRDIDKALSYWRQAADRQDAQSMIELVNVYDEEKSEAQSVEWRQKAYLSALQLYQRNEFAKCIFILERLVEKNDVSAINLLAECYRRGVGVDQNLNRSVQLWSDAVARGDGSAAYAMGESYWCGLPGLEKDESKALELWQTAADLGYEPAKDRLENAAAA